MHSTHSFIREYLWLLGLALVWLSAELPVVRLLAARYYFHLGQVTPESAME